MCIYVFGSSVLMNGFIMNVLALSLNLMENGTVQSVLLN